MGKRLTPDWQEDGTMPPGWSLEYRPEATGDAKWELKHGEGHVRLFKYDGDAVIFARKQELADIESGSVQGIQTGIPGRTPRQFADLLLENATAYHEDRVSYDDFRSRQRVLWGEIEAIGLNDGVLEILRKRADSANTARIKPRIPSGAPHSIEGRD